MQFRTCIFLALVFLVPPIDAKAQGMEWLREVAETMKGFQADFTYTTSSQHWDDSQMLRGRLVLQGSQFRVDTDTDIIIAQGPDTYTYRPFDHQVLITVTEPTFSPATIFGDFEQYYAVEEIRRVNFVGVPHFAVTLSPHDTDLPVEEATLWIRSEDYLVSRIQLVDLNDTTTEFRLTNVQLRPQVDPSVFDLTFPDDVEIIDLRY